MPNWFYFSLNVSGEKKDVEQFVKNVKGSENFDTEGREFDFNHFIPQPENIFRGNLGNKEEEYCKKNGLPDWYTWNNANWGTKWNAVCDDEIAISVDGFPFEHEYNLSTAWAFPTPVIKKMIEMYPNLDFTIVGEEESNAYGVYIVSSEEIWEEEEPEMVDESNDKEVYWDNYKYLWRYLDNDEEVEDSDSFYPMAKYSWS
jgi:hypothetical protein